MSKIILYIATSLDGFIATKDGGVAWLDQFSDGSQDYGYHDFIQNIDINIQGANTYKQVLSFDVDWPYKSKSYILTHHELDIAAGADVEFFHGNIIKLVNKAKKESQKDIWLIGGANLVQKFLEKSLIDEIIISVMPVFLGDGISLFGDEGVEKKLNLVNSQSYKSGVIQLHYSL